jgi:hypothetical protein
MASIVIERKCLRGNKSGFRRQLDAFVCHEVKLKYLNFSTMNYVRMNYVRNWRMKKQWHSTWTSWKGEFLKSFQIFFKFYWRAQGFLKIKFQVIDTNLFKFEIWKKTKQNKIEVWISWKVQVIVRFKKTLFLIK